MSDDSLFSPRSRPMLLAAMREFRPARLNYPTPEDEEMDADPSLPSLPNHWEFGGGLATAHPSPADTSSVAPQSLRDALTTAIAEAWAAQSPETNPWIDDAGQPFASWIAEQVAPFLRAALRSTPAAPEDGLREAAEAVDTAWERYQEAHAGRGHDGPHLIVPAISDDECGQCISDQYGTEVEMVEYAMPALRAALRPTPAAQDRIQSVYTAIRAGIVNATTLPRNTDVVTWAVIKAAFMADAAAPAAPQPDTALTVERLARARATDGGWKEPNVTDRKWAEQFLAILRALGEGAGEGVDRG